MFQTPDFTNIDSSLAALGFWQYQPETGQIKLSTEAAKLYGISGVTECALLNIKQKIHPADWELFETAWTATLQGQAHDIEYRIQESNGSLRWLWQKAALEFNTEQKISSIHGIVQDISRHREICRTLTELANHDRLTGLPNRRLLAEHLSVAIPLAKRNKWTLSVFFIDLDKFKQVNDQLGHDAGDELLRQVATRIKECLRDSDLVARQGGDEFIVVLQNSGIESDVGLCALSIIEQLSRPFNLNGKIANIGASIGVTLMTPNTENAEELFHQADVAMYQAKLAGRQTLVFYDHEMQSDVLLRRQLEGDLYRAVANNELCMLYQPIYHLSKQQSNQVEALLRWQHPEHGLIGPEVFMNVAETSNVTQNIVQWILTEVCQQIAIWQQQGQHMTVFVKISARQAGEALPLTWLENLIHKYQIPKHALTFEFTEQTLLQADPSLRQWLYGIEQLGITLTLEHFGEGQASLALLRNFNIYRVKIDRSLLNQINHDKRAHALVKSIIDIAHNMVIQVVAEGVENAATLSTLQSLGCQEAQGFHLGHPMPAKQITPTDLRLTEDQS